MDRMVEGYERRDVALILSCYEPGALYVTPVGEAVAGADDLQILFNRILAMNPDLNFSRMRSRSLEMLLFTSAPMRAAGAMAPFIVACPLPRFGDKLRVTGG